MPVDRLALAVPGPWQRSFAWAVAELSHFLPIAYLRIRDLSLRRRYQGTGLPRDAGPVPFLPRIGAIANRRAQEDLAQLAGAGTTPCHDSAGHAAIRFSLRWRRTFVKSTKRRS